MSFQWLPSEDDAKASENLMDRRQLCLCSDVFAAALFEWQDIDSKPTQSFDEFTVDFRD